jgi:hypothetical protein
MIMQVAVGSDLFCALSEPQTSLKPASCRLASIFPQIPISSAVLATNSGALCLPTALPACPLTP